MPQLHRLRDVDPVAIALCKKGANGQRIFLRKSEGEQLITVAEGMALHKSAQPDWTTLYCVVAQPNTPENGGMLAPDVVDVWDSPEEIRKAAHRLLKNQGYVNAEHGEGKVEAHIVESAVALAPIPLDDITVPTGAWYVGIEPSVELRKAYDDGELTGVSLEGTGVREVVGVLPEAPDADKKTLWKRLGEALGLAEDSGTLTQEPHEETDVADTNIKDLETKVEDIAKAQGAATTAIEGLIGTVNKLVERLDKPVEKEGEEKADAASIKKSVDELAATVAERLDAIDVAVDALNDPGSDQHREPDQLKKTSTDPLAGIL